MDALELKTAVELHQRAHGLLQWLEHPVRKGMIRLETVNDSISTAEAARQWVEGNYFDLPTKLRPRYLEDPELEYFSNLLASYLTVSFNLVEKPKSRLASDRDCEFYSCMISLSHIQPKKLRRGDKEQAQKRIREYLDRLAANQEITVKEAFIVEVLNDAELFKKAALATYGEQLIERMHGDFTNPSALALWRIFAWESTGSPKHDFKLDAADILQSERDLVAALAALSCEPSGQHPQETR